MFFPGILIPAVYRFRPNGDDVDSSIFDVLVLEPLPDGAAPGAAGAHPRLGVEQSIPRPRLGWLAPVYDEDTGNLDLQTRGLKTSRKGSSAWVTTRRCGSGSAPDPRRVHGPGQALPMSDREFKRVASLADMPGARPAAYRRRRGNTAGATPPRASSPWPISAPMPAARMSEGKLRGCRILCRSTGRPLTSGAARCSVDPRGSPAQLSCEGRGRRHLHCAGGIICAGR